MDVHYCVCGLSVEEHRERSDDCGERHFPALCCKGCPCRSFEEAHLAGDHEEDGSTRTLWLVGGTGIDSRVVHLPARPESDRQVGAHARTLCRRSAMWRSRPPRRGQRVCHRCVRVWEGS